MQWQSKTGDSVQGWIIQLVYSYWSYDGPNIEWKVYICTVIEEKDELSNEYFFFFDENIQQDMEVMCGFSLIYSQENICQTRK